MSLPFYAKNFMPPQRNNKPVRNSSTIAWAYTGPVENQGYTYTLEDDPSHTSFDVPVWIRIANRRQI